MAIVWYKWWVLWEPKPEFWWSGVQICNTPGQVHDFFECHLNLPHVINSTSNLVEPLSVLGGKRCPIQWWRKLWWWVLLGVKNNTATELRNYHHLDATQNRNSGCHMDLIRDLWYSICCSCRCILVRTPPAKSFCQGILKFAWCYCGTGVETHYDFSYCSSSKKQWALTVSWTSGCLLQHSVHFVWPPVESRTANFDLFRQLLLFPILLYQIGLKKNVYVELPFSSRLPWFHACFFL